MNLLLTLIVSLFASIYCTQVHKVQTRVFGGKPAKRKDFPYQVRLFLKRRNSSKNTYNCAGALISDSHILTAAHCFFPHGPMAEVLNAGLAIVGSIQKDIPTESDALHRIFDQGDIFIHHGFTSQSYSDIAIIKLKQPVTFKAEAIESVRLPARSQGSLIGETVTVAGWGKTSDQNKTGTDILLYTRFSVVPDDECNRIVDYKPNIDMCAKSNTTSTCEGDSGSGVTIKENDGIKTIVAIVSGGLDNCDEVGPQIFTNVHHHLIWIYTITGLPVRH